MRDKLIELIDNAGIQINGNVTPYRDYGIENLADYILTNGVIVPPCKVGDKVYRISMKNSRMTKYIQETTISRIAIDNEGIWLFCACNPIARCVFGKTVFLTKEEAEQALKGGAE